MVEITIDRRTIIVSDRLEKIIRMVLSSPVDEHPKVHLEFDCSDKRVIGKIEVPLEDKLTTA